LGDVRNQKGWPHKMTRSGAKNDFFRKSGAGKSGCVAQVRHVSSGIGGRRQGILRLPGELARGVGVWNALRMRSSILVHGFPSTLVRGLCTLRKKPVSALGKWKMGFSWQRCQNPAHSVDSRPRAHTYGIWPRSGKLCMPVGHNLAHLT
jgi:hypothetical protein